MVNIIKLKVSQQKNSFVKLQPDLEPNPNEPEQTWTSRVRSWLCFPMSQEQEQEQEEEPHLILPYMKGLQVST